MSEGRSAKIDIRQISTINKLGQVGTQGMADNLTMLGSGDSTMEVRKMEVLDIVDRHKELPDDKRVGVRIRLNDAPGGHLLVMFPQKSAQKVTEQMLSNATDDMSGVSQEMAQDAAEELGHMLVNGFIDEWADTFGLEVDHSAPKLLYDPASSIIKRTAKMGNNPLAIVFQSTIETDGEAVTAEIYLLPDTSTFVQMLDAISDG